MGKLITPIEQKKEKALESIYNWASFSLKHRISLSFSETQKIKDMAAVGLGLKENEVK